MEDETASFSTYFGSHARPFAAGISAANSDGGSSAGVVDYQVHEVVLPLHDEALQMLTKIAHFEGVSGSNEYMRSVALQLSLDKFAHYCREHDGELSGELHFSAGPMKDRALCLFSDTLTDLARLERDLHCSETILLETAIRQAADAAGVAPPN